MELKGLAFSLFLHFVIIIVMSGIIGRNTSDDDFIKTADDNISMVKLQLGNPIVLDSYRDYDYSEHGIEPGLDDPNYGRIVSQIVLKHLNHSNIVLIGNRADIIIKLSKNGKVVSSAVLLQSNDHALHSKISNALKSSDLTFPPNPKAKSNITYKLSLF